MPVLSALGPKIKQQGFAREKHHRELGECRAAHLHMSRVLTRELIHGEGPGSQNEGRPEGEGQG